MLINLLTGKDAKQRNFGGVLVDATIKESHRFENTVTRYPVEIGFDVADHVTKKPREYTIEGLIVASPLNGITTATDRSRLQRSFQSLKALAGWRTTASTPSVFSIVTDLDVYQNMVITSLEFDRDVETGDSISFNARLEQIITSSTMYTSASGVTASTFTSADGIAVVDSSKNATTSPTSDQGTIPTKEVESKSLLFQALTPRQ
jgi:hypothetical protein